MAIIKRGLVAAGILIGGAFAPIYGAPQVKVPRESWMGMYYGGAKIGYMHSVLDRSQYKDLPCYKLESFSRSKLMLLGVNIQQDFRATIYADDSFAPLYEEFEISSGGSVTKILATFTEKTVECEIISESSMKKSVPIPEGARLVGDNMYGFEGREIKVGDKLQMYAFSALTLTIDEVTSEVEREEEIECGGVTYKTFVIKYKTPLGELTNWQTADGDTIKTVAMMGMTMLKETKEQALAEEDSSGERYMPPSDFAVLTSVKADKDIKNPNSVREMKIRLIGLKDKDLLITDFRQTARSVPRADPPAADFHIQAKEYDAKRSVTMADMPGGLGSFLEETPYIQVKDEAIAKTVSEIVGESQSAYERASKIRAWLHKTMKPQANIGVPRSAVDILKQPVGVCRDYATLYTALARAAGIPTKMVAGLVYMNGSFYYHAWAESFVGEWIPFDATLSTDFVDATHIKFTEGDATSMFLISRIIGTLKAEIQDTD